MRNIKFLLLITFASSISIAIFAQKQFTGTITYSVEIENNEFEFEEMIKSQLPNSLVISTNGIQTRIDVVSKMFTIITIVDNQTDYGTMLFDAETLGMKYAISISKEDIEKGKLKLNPEIESLTINYIDETKTIAGYKCKKAEIITVDDEVIEIFYNEDIVFPSEMYEQINNGIKDLNGTLMEFSINTYNMRMKYTCTEVKTGTPKVSFSIPDDFEKISMEQYLKSFGGMVE